MIPSKQPLINFLPVSQSFDILDEWDKPKMKEVWELTDSMEVLASANIADIV